MWDAWAAYDPSAVGYFVDEQQTTSDVEAARREAISYAAYRILEHRYANAAGVTETMADLDSLMQRLCYPVEATNASGDTPAALGNRIAAAVITYGAEDGANERDGYDWDYSPVNPPLVFDQPGTELLEPNHWQPLAFDVAIAQNGLPVAAGTQHYIGPHWGFVRGFALEEHHAGLPIDPGPPPLLGPDDAEYIASAVEVIAASSSLDPADGVVIDIGPGSVGNNPLGTNDGTGHETNPATERPYTPNLVLAADYGRVIAEFWADGPESETPPGHWNTVANWMTDRLSDGRRIGGAGEPVDPLEWDVKLYFALNGALHDAAIAAWGAKAYYDYVRPISMIRHLGGLGQSSDSSLPSYHPRGLSLRPGLVELITEDSVTAGERHAHLSEFVDEVAIRAWTGTPDDPEREVGGVGWIRVVEWIPYQLSTFVTPSFPGYVSGHSTFSRAGAEVLTAITGDPFFPRGLGEWTIPAGTLEFEAGPSQDITLQWATYRDAADQAGLSRIYGGIHVAADDLAGRIMGATCGVDAWDLAQRYWDGTARPVGVASADVSG